ncbi:MAG: divergent polysaccharide deacetylase family protein, partial [Pseudomonadota bacterium]
MMLNKLSHLTKACDAVFSTRALGRSLVGLIGLTFLGFISGAVLFHDIPGPPQKLTGISLAHVDIKELIIEEPIHSPIPPSAETTPLTTHVESSPPVEIKPDAEAGLYEVTSYGSLPIIRERDHMTPFKAYHGTFSAKPTTKGLIAIVMVDFALSDITAKDAILNLPSEISFVASPYAGGLQEKITNARSYGHEIWMHIPIEGANFGNDDSGPVTLLTGLKKENNILRLKSILGRATGYSGVIMTEAPNFSSSPENLTAIFGEIAQRGLGYTQADSNDTTTATLAASLNIPHALSNI